jgi:hypothetical protein
VIEKLFQLHCVYEEMMVGTGTTYNGFHLVLYSDGSGYVGGTKTNTGEREYYILEWEKIETGIALLKTYINLKEPPRDN